MSNAIRMKTDSQVTVTMTSANTEYSASIPKGARVLTMSLADSSVAWRMAWVTGVVATSGHNLAAATLAREFEFAANAKATTVYFASSTASQTMVISYGFEESA